VERQRDRAAYLSVGIHDDAVLIVVGIPDGQRMAQFPLLCLVEFTAEEAPAQKMQLRLRHCALEPQQQPIVEVRRVVAAIGIDDQGVRQCAQLQQAVPGSSARGATPRGQTPPPPGPSRRRQPAT
jgi:hypothetical protein